MSRIVLSIVALSAAAIPLFAQEVTTASWNLIDNRPGNTRWVGDLLVLVGLGGVAEADADIARFARELQPDLNDRSPEFAVAPWRSLGMRSSSKGPEYQETAEDGDGAPLAEIVGVMLNGERAATQTPDGLRLLMCHNRPGWRERYRERLLEFAPRFDAINQDGVAALWRGGGCFCPDCVAGFREWLDERLPPDELAALGVAPAGAFDFRADALDRLTTQGAELFARDPLACRYVVYQALSQCDRWSEHAEALRGLEDNLGCALPIGGDQGDMRSGAPVAIALSQVNDFVGVKADAVAREYAPPRGPLNGLTYQLGLASGGFAKPVWTHGGLFGDGRKAADGRTARAPLFQRRFLQLTLSEAYANGGVRALTLADEDAPPARMDARFYRACVEYADFLNGHRAVFQDRDSLARVAVVFDLPSSMLRSFPAWQTADRTRQWFEAAARALLKLHEPFDALIFGYPELFDDSASLERLNRYRLIVLPQCELLTPRQRAMLEDYLDTGGRIVALGPAGAMNVKFEPSQPPAWAARDSTGVVVYAPGRVDAAALDSGVLAAIQRALPEAGRLVATNAPALTTVNVWAARSAARIAIHLLNYDIDIAADTGKAVKDLTVSLALPLSFPRHKKAIVLSPGASTREVALEYDDIGGRVRFTLPTLDLYSIVVLGDAAELGAASELSRLRRDLRRVQTLGALSPADEQAYLDAQRQYDAGQFADSARAARALRDRRVISSPRSAPVPETARSARAW